MKITRYFSPARWKVFLQGQIELHRRRVAAEKLDAVWRDFAPLQSDPNGQVLLVDGMWLNPGYFLRLRLTIDAIARSGPVRLIGLLRTKRDKRQRRFLDRIGVTEFVYCEGDARFPSAGHVARAKEMLAPVADHAGLLKLALPTATPPSIWYDSVLSNLRNGQPEIGHPQWTKDLAELLAYIDSYNAILERYRPTKVLLSHAWKNVWGSLAWLALAKGAEVLCVTQVSEAIRIRRFRRPDDFNLPVEHMTKAVYESLDASVKDAMVKLGYAELERRQRSQTSDVNIRFAYDTSARVLDRHAARAALGVHDETPIGVIYGHSWFDFPHLYNMQNFTDFCDWLKKTNDIVARETTTRWFLKPHPMETWYGGQTMRDIVSTSLPHVSFLPHKIDTMTVMRAADAIVTVHGTAGLEAAMLGTPVICADNSYYAEWGFAQTARSGEHYGELLSQLGALKPLDQYTRDVAAACFLAAYGEPHDYSQALRVPCDSRGAMLYDEVRDIVGTQDGAMRAEVGRIAEFLAQGMTDSLSAWTFLKAAESRAEQAQTPLRAAN
jgi:hypothetical protein